MRTVKGRETRTHESLAQLLGLKDHGREQEDQA